MIHFPKTDDLLKDEEEEWEDPFTPWEDLYRVVLPKLTVYDPHPDSWRKLALCALYPSINFFDGYQKEQAKAVCAECPVTKRCLQFAIENGEHGVWGGTDDKERKHLAIPKPKADRTVDRHRRIGRTRAS